MLLFQHGLDKLVKTNLIGWCDVIGQKPWIDGAVDVDDYSVIDLVGSSVELEE